MREGHDVRVVAPLAPGAPPPGDPAHVVRVAVRARGRGLVANLASQLRLMVALRRASRRLVLSWEPDVVLVSTPPPLAALAALGLHARGRRRIAVVADVRDIWPDVLIEAGALRRGSPATAVLSAASAILLRRASAVTTPTELKRARLAARTSAPVTVVVNGVDAVEAREEPAYRGGGAEGPFEALYAGNVGRAQDVGLLVRAVRAVRSMRERSRHEGRAVVATIVGDGEDARAVAALAADAPVTIHSGETRAAVAERLACCGCAFVSLRTALMRDAVPSKMLEAMARGVPVVLAGAGEAASILEAAGGGWVVPPGDVSALARALELVAALSPEERRAIGARGRAHVLAHFRRESAARELSRVLIACCRVRGSEPS